MDWEQLYHDKCCEKLRIQTQLTAAQKKIEELEKGAIRVSHNHRKEIAEIYERKQQEFHGLNKQLQKLVELLGEKESLKSVSPIILDNNSILKDEITLLKAKLIKAIGQRNEMISRFRHDTNEEKEAARFEWDSEIESITLESLKYESAKASAKNQMELSKVLDDNEDR